MLEWASFEYLRSLCANAYYSRELIVVHVVAASSPPPRNLLRNITFRVVRGTYAIEMYGEVGSAVCSEVIVTFYIFWDMHQHKDCNGA